MRRRAHARNASSCDGLADPARRRKLPKVLLAACVQIARKQRRDAAVGGHAPLFAASTAADGGDAAIGELAVTVRNVGEVEAADVVLVYRTPPNAGVDGVPLREILGFERVHLPPKGSATLRFPLSSRAFELADEGGTFRRVAGRWALVAGGETLAHVDVPPAG